MRQVLFLTEDREDYLADGLLHGLIQCADLAVVDYPRKTALYREGVQAATGLDGLCPPRYPYGPIACSLEFPPFPDGPVVDPEEVRARPCFAALAAVLASSGLFSVALAF